MNKKIALLIAFTLIVLSFTISTKAEQNDETSIDVQVITDENLTAYFNGTSTEGFVSYYIEGIEVLTELKNINTLIATLQLLETENTNALATDIQSVFDTLITELGNLNNKLLDKIDNVHGNVLSNLALIDQNSISIKSLKENLSILKDNLYMLRDEVIGFEESYLENISRINIMLDEINEKLSLHESLIQKNQQNISELQQKFDDLNSNLANFGGVGLLFIVSLIIFYMINKTHIYKKILDSNLIPHKLKQHSLLDFTEKNKRMTISDRINLIKINKNKSPLKFLFSFFNVNK
jgi:hypothetical protein